MSLPCANHPTVTSLWPPLTVVIFVTIYLTLPSPLSTLSLPPTLLPPVIVPCIFIKLSRYPLHLFPSHLPTSACYCCGCCSHISHPSPTPFKLLFVNGHLPTPSSSLSTHSLHPVIYLTLSTATCLSSANSCTCSLSRQLSPF